MSSEDPTQQLNAGADTKPTLEAVIHRIDRLGALVNQRFDQLERSFNIRLDRIASEVKETHAELYTLRADFQELSGELKELIPQLR
jgi:hypothetical protein